MEEDLLGGGGGAPAFSIPEKTVRIGESFGGGGDPFKPGYAPTLGTESGIDWTGAGNAALLSSTGLVISQLLGRSERRQTRKAYRQALSDLRRSVLLQNIYTQNEMNARGLGRGSIGDVVSNIQQEGYNRRIRDVSRKYRHYKKSQTFGGQLQQMAPGMIGAGVGTLVGQPMLGYSIGSQL